MSNRAQRRADLADFKREAHRAHLVTHLIAADAPLDGHPLLREAASYWRSNIRQRRPCCIACKANFTDDVELGAFLFAVPVLAQAASISVLCTRCWTDLSPDQIDAACTRVLVQLSPHGRFLDDPP